jgi:SAM-dependent methyltransferase
MKLNLGSSDALLPPPWINVDICPPTDLIADLTKPWPWASDSVADIRAYDIIEHLPDKIHTMNEAWRVLRPGGVFDVVVPTTDGPGAWQDPQHCSFWNRNSFFYYTAGDAHRERFGKAYGVQARFRVIRERLDVPGGVPKLTIVLEAVK